MVMYHPCMPILRSLLHSSNQSPVLKFYNSMYADAAARRAKYSNGSEAVLAMHLWNDWNTQALKWEQAHESDADFDYLVMRSEDLVDPEKKFQTLVQLADFVESPMTMEEICCLSKRDAVDLGQSVRWTGEKRTGRFPIDKVKQRQLRKGLPHEKYGSTQGKPPDRHHQLFRTGGGRLWNYRNHADNFRGNKPPYQMRTGKDKNQHDGTPEDTPKLHERYGKWRGLLKDKPDLSAKLHKEGADGLATFGYEPHQAHLADTGTVISDFICDESVVCGQG